MYNGTRAILIDATMDPRCSTFICDYSNSGSCSRPGILDFQISNPETATAEAKGSLKEKVWCSLKFQTKIMDRA